MSKMTYQYLAGLIDADGSIQFNRRKGDKYRASLKIEIRQRYILEELRSFLQSEGYTNLPNIITRIPKNPNYNITYVFQLSSENHVGVLLQSLLPYLKIKNIQAGIIASFLHVKSLTPEQNLLFLKESIYHTMKYLNQRGNKRDSSRLDQGLPGAIQITN